MKISRHARNNMRLYGIKEKELSKIIDSPDFKEIKGGKHMCYKSFPKRFSGLPIKTIFVVEEETVIITVYPLKKAYKK